MENTTKKLRGLRVDVFRSGLGDCTNGGLTSKHNTVILVGEGVDGPVEVEEGDPVLFLRPGRGGREYVATPAPERRGMFGGNFVYSCDARFHAISDTPIHVHDRFE